MRSCLLESHELLKQEKEVVGVHILLSVVGLLAAVWKKEKHLRGLMT